MTDIPDVVIKNGRIVTAQKNDHTRIYAGVAVLATLVATGLGGYIFGMSSAKSGNPDTVTALATPQQNVAQTGQRENSVQPPAPSATDPGANDAISTLQTAVNAALKNTVPSSENDKKFIQAQQEYLSQKQETPEQVKARLDQLAADPKALEAHNRTVMNRITANTSNAPPSTLQTAVMAATQALQDKPKASITSALNAEAAVREASARTYQVRAGDTLWDIAQRIYGDPYQYKRLFEANPRVLASPEHIFPGQVLRVPA